MFRCSVLSNNWDGVEPGSCSSEEDNEDEAGVEEDSSCIASSFRCRFFHLFLAALLFPIGDSEQNRPGVPMQVGDVDPDV